MLQDSSETIRKTIAQSNSIEEYFGLPTKQNTNHRTEAWVQIHWGRHSENWFLTLWKGQHKVQEYVHRQKDIACARMALYLNNITKEEYLKYYLENCKEPHNPKKPKIPKVPYDESKLSRIDIRDVESVFGNDTQDKGEGLQ